MVHATLDREMRKNIDQSMAQRCSKKTAKLDVPE